METEKEINIMYYSKIIWEKSLSKGKILLQEIWYRFHITTAATIHQPLCLWSFKPEHENKFNATWLKFGPSTFLFTLLTSSDLQLNVLGSVIYVYRSPSLEWNAQISSFDASAILVHDFLHFHTHSFTSADLTNSIAPYLRHHSRPNVHRRFTKLLGRISQVVLSLCIIIYSVYRHICSYKYYKYLNYLIIFLMFIAKYKRNIFYIYMLIYTIRHHILLYYNTIDF